jgi:hypothetical protein
MRNFNGGNCRLLADNAPTHVVDLCFDGMDENNIRWIKIPPFSPDINIIELVWAELKRFLRKKLLKNQQEIADRVQLFFETQLTVEKCRNYIERVHEVLIFPLTGICQRNRLFKNFGRIFRPFKLFFGIGMPFVYFLNRRIQE